MILNIGSHSWPNTSTEVCFSLVLDKVLYVFLQNSLQRNNRESDEEYKLMTRKDFARNQILDYIT